MSRAAIWSGASWHGGTVALQLNPSFPSCFPPETQEVASELPLGPVPGLPVLTPAVLAWHSRPGHPGIVLLTWWWEFLWDSSAFFSGPAQLPRTDMAIGLGAFGPGHPSGNDSLPALATEPELGPLSPRRCNAEGNSCPSLWRWKGHSCPLWAPRHPVLWVTDWGPQQERV